MWFVMLRIHSERSPVPCWKAGLLPHVIYILLVTYSRIDRGGEGYMIVEGIPLVNSIKAYMNECLPCRSLPNPVYPRT